MRDEPDDAHDATRLAADLNGQMRVRAAWLYYVDGLTQSEIAKKLGLNRVSVTRLLSDARRRGEVVIRVKSEIAPLASLQTQLEERYGLARAIVAPLGSDADDPTTVIAAAAGAYVSETMRDGMTVGVGWGRTLHTMLPFVEGKSLDGVRVISLLGGVAQVRRFNPAEFAWRFAQAFNAEGFLIPAPALVDSPATKEALLRQCGLDQIIEMADACDAALLSCADIASLTTSYRVGHVSEAERRSLLDAGAVGDVLYSFIDADGRRLDHPVNDRAIAISYDSLRRLENKVLLSGGVAKTAVIRACLLGLRPRTLITDEATARRLLA